jgi:hypothetical protein
MRDSRQPMIWTEDDIAGIRYQAKAGEDGLKRLKCVLLWGVERVN